MKTHLFIRLVLYFTASLTILSCSLDEVVEQDTSVKVTFVNQTQTITEDMETISVPLTLDPKATITGYITIELSGNAAYGNDYITEPQAVNNKIILKLLANTKDTSFVISRVNRTSAEKLINIKLSNPTTGFSLGTRVASEVKLDAQPNLPNILNFDASEGTISEGHSEGLVIGLNTTHIVSNGSSAKIKLTIPQNITYGTHFYTVPAAILNEITLELNQDTQSTSLKIVPVNDDSYVGDYAIAFEIVEVTAELEIGELNTYTAHVLENDDPAVINIIADLKSKFNEHEGDWYLSTDYFIEGVITSNGNMVDHQSVYIQDASAGILIRFNMSNSFNLGDKIKINLKNGYGKIVNGEKRVVDLNLSQAVKYAENIVVQPEIITIDQLNTGNYEGKRVKLVGVYFENADGLLVFEGNHFIKQGNLSAIVTTYASAAFSDYVIPEGLISVTGIVGNWNYILPQKYTHDITN